MWWGRRLREGNDHVDGDVVVVVVDPDNDYQMISKSCEIAFQEQQNQEKLLITQT